MSDTTCGVERWVVCPASVLDARQGWRWSVRPTDAHGAVTLARFHDRASAESFAASQFDRTIRTPSGAPGGPGSPLAPGGPGGPGSPFGPGWP